jgi:hypothetical protein
MNRSDHIGGALLFVCAGPLVWAAHLFAVYGAHALVCARIPAHAAVLPVLFVALTLAALAPLAYAVWRPDASARMFRGNRRGGESEFLTALMRLLALLSLAGILWAGAATLTLPYCGQLR